jgi:hypothetical protein
MPYTVRMKRSPKSWATIRSYDDLKEAEKEYSRLNKVDKKGTVRVLALFHGRKKIKQNFYD